MLVLGGACDGGGGDARREPPVGQARDARLWAVRLGLLNPNLGLGLNPNPNTNTHSNPNPNPNRSVVTLCKAGCCS